MDDNTMEILLFIACVLHNLFLLNIVTADRVKTYITVNAANSKWYKLEYGTKDYASGKDRVDVKIVGIYGIDIISTYPSGYRFREEFIDRPLYLGHVKFIQFKSNNSVIITFIRYEDNYRKYHTAYFQNYATNKHPIIVFTLVNCHYGWQPIHVCTGALYRVNFRAIVRENVQLCDSDLFRLYFMGLFGKIHVEITKKHLIQSSYDSIPGYAADIGALQSVQLKTISSCNAFRVYMNISLTTDSNIYHIHDRFESDSSNSITNIRVVCRRGSKEPVCNHVEYTLYIRCERDDFPKSLHLTVIGELGSFQIRKINMQRIDIQLTTEHYNVGVIKLIRVENISFGRFRIAKFTISNGHKFDLLICDTINFNTDVRIYSNCKNEFYTRGELAPQHSICLLGSDCKNCDKAVVSLSLQVRDTHTGSIDVSIYSNQSGIPHAVLRTTVKEDSNSGSLYSYIGGEYNVKRIDKITYISFRYVTDDSVAPVEIRNITIFTCNNKYIFGCHDVNGCYISQNRPYSVMSSTRVCLAGWSDPDCQRVLYRFAIKTTDPATDDGPVDVNIMYTGHKDYRRVSISTTELSTKSLETHKEELYCGNIKTIKATVSDIPSKTVLETLIISDGRHMFKFEIDIQSRTTDHDMSFSRTSHDCPPGLTGDRCETECSDHFKGIGCQPCQCANGQKCDKTTGWCNSGGNCTSRFMSPYCDWTCTTNYLFGQFCQSEVRTSCDSVQYICPSDCVKSSSGKCMEKATPACTGTYGRGCALQCHCLNNAQCNPTTGQCDNCDFRYWGSSCQHRCAEGMFHSGEGQVSCNNSCHCLDQQKCLAATGQCYNSPCDYGWRGKSCRQKCAFGTFGFKCARNCSCIPGGGCDHISGKCNPRCQPRLAKGLPCDEMECKYKFGPNCEHECHCIDRESDCDIETGKCHTGCQRRYTGPSCQVTCPIGFFYDKAVKDCRGCQCKNKDKCIITTGECADSLCHSIRRVGSDCQTTCEDGRFIEGDACTGQCHCTSLCYVSNGSCEHGACAAGWHGAFCQTSCTDGTFGLNCQMTCHCLNDEPCDKVKGNCDSGCSAGRIGEDCQGHEMKTGTSKSMNEEIGIWIGATVAMVFATIVAVVAFVNFSRKRGVAKKSSYGQSLPEAGADYSTDGSIQNSQTIYHDKDYYDKLNHRSVINPTGNSCSTMIGREYSEPEYRSLYETRDTGNPPQLFYQTGLASFGSLENFVFGKRRQLLSEPYLENENESRQYETSPMAIDSMQFFASKKPQKESIETPRLFGVYETYYPTSIESIEYLVGLYNKRRKKSFDTETIRKDAYTYCETVPMAIDSMEVLVGLHNKQRMKSLKTRRHDVNETVPMTNNSVACLAGPPNKRRKKSLEPRQDVCETDPMAVDSMALLAGLPNKRRKKSFGTDTPRQNTFENYMDYMRYLVAMKQGETSHQSQQPYYADGSYSSGGKFRRRSSKKSKRHRREK